MSGAGRYNSFEDHQHDVQFSILERRVRNLETVVGAVGTGLHSQLMYVPGAGQTYTLGTYVAVPGLSLNFDKRSLGSLLRVRIDASGFFNVLGSKATFGVDCVHTDVSYLDVDVSPFFFNEANAHRHWGYEVDLPTPSMFVPLLGSGNVAVTGKVKVSGNTLTTDASDLLVMTVTEIEPYF